MNKTKHLKRRRLLKKTKKYLGGNGNEQFNGENSVNNMNNMNDKKEGVIDIIKDKAGDFAENTGNFLKDKTLRLFGLQPINENENEYNQDNADSQQINKTVDSTVNKFSNATSGIVSDVQDIVSDVKTVGKDVVNVFNKGSAAVIGNINAVLESPKIEKSVTEAASETATIGAKLLEKFNQNLNNPEFKEATRESLDNISDYAEIGVKALNAPLDNAIDEFNEAGTKAAAGVATGVIKVGTDALGAVPGIGAIVDVGKMINDSTRAASTVVEAGSDAAETASELFIQTNEGIKQGIKELEEKKNEAMNIANRTADSINQFQNPSLDFSNENSNSNNTSSKVGGGKKTKKRLLKRKAKSKRVRFAL